MKSATGRTQPWELFADLARLSYMTPLAGLAVAFPVDLAYSYGWDLCDMILRAQERWARAHCDVATVFLLGSTQPSRTSPKTRETLRAHGPKAMKFVELVASRQVDRGHALLVEQPWSSAM